MPIPGSLVMCRRCGALLEYGTPACLKAKDHMLHISKGWLCRPCAERLGEIFRKMVRRGS